MSIMTEDQVKLLHKLQMAEIPAFKNINPLTLQEDEARDLFRMNLPPLEWINAYSWQSAPLLTPKNHPSRCSAVHRSTLSLFLLLILLVLIYTILYI